MSRTASFFYSGFRWSLVALAPAWIWAQPVWASFSIHTTVLDDSARPLETLAWAAHPVIDSRSGDKPPEPGFAYDPATGRFEAHSLSPGPWCLTLEADGFMPKEVCRLSTGADVVIREIRLIRDVGLRVRVLSASGRPLEGVTVAARVEGALGESRERRRATTDHDGWARLPRAAGEVLSVGAVAPGFVFLETQADSGPIQLHLVEASAGQAADVQRPEDGRLQVENVDGEPAVDARVWLGRSEVPVGQTDERGELALLASPGTPFKILDAEEASARGVWQGNTRQGDMLRLRLAAPQRLAGRIEDARTGSPVDGAWVWWPGRIARAVSADQDGVFELVVPGAAGIAPPELDKTRLAVQVAALGYEPSAVEAGSSVVSLQPLARPGFGVVSNLGGEPVSGASVALWPAQRGGADPWEGPTSSVIWHGADADGRFEVPGVWPGVYHLIAKAPGYALATVRDLEVSPAEAPHDFGTLALAESDGLRGFVLDADGRGIDGAEVWLEMSRETEAAARGLSVTTDVAGAFELFDAPAEGHWYLRARQARYLDSGVFVALPAEQEISVTLERAAVVSGRVVDEGGLAVAGARVVAVSPDEPSADIEALLQEAAGVADDDGRFELLGVRPGNVLVMASAPGFQSGELELPSVEAEGEDDVEIVLTRGKALVGRVLSSTGEPVRGARIRLLEGPGPAPHLQTESRDDGRYRLDGLPPGRLRIQASHPEQGQVSKRLELWSGEERMNLRLVPGISVNGRVVDGSGQGIDGVEVTLFGLDASGSRDARVHSRSGGQFRFTQIQPGRYRLQAHGAGYGSTEQLHEVELGGATDWVVRLDEGSSLVGKVHGVSFDELSSVNVFASGSQGTLMATVDYEAGFRLDGLKPGAWEVAARFTQDGRQASQWVDIRPGDREVEVDLEIPTGFRISGRLTADGRGLSGYVLQLNPENGGPDWMTMSDSQGVYVFHGASAGTYQLTVSHPTEGPAHRQELTVYGDQTLSLSIDAGGSPAPGQ